MGAWPAPGLITPCTLGLGHWPAVWHKQIILWCSSARVWSFHGNGDWGRFGTFLLHQSTAYNLWIPKCYYSTWVLDAWKLFYRFANKIGFELDITWWQCNVLSLLRKYIHHHTQCQDCQVRSIVEPVRWPRTRPLSGSWQGSYLSAYLTTWPGTLLS